MPRTTPVLIDDGALNDNPPRSIALSLYGASYEYFAVDTGRWQRIPQNDPAVRNCDTCGVAVLGEGNHQVACAGCGAHRMCGAPATCACIECARCEQYYGEPTTAAACNCCAEANNRCRRHCPCTHCSCFVPNAQGLQGYCSSCITSGDCECSDACDCGVCNPHPCGCCDEPDGACSSCCDHYCCDTYEPDNYRYPDDPEGENSPTRVRLPRDSFFHQYDLTFYTPKKTQLKKVPSTRYAAVEIEVAGAKDHSGTRSATEKWNCSVVHDGSLPEGGFEINTSPAAGDLLYDQITQLCAGLKRDQAYVTRSCGLHAHVDARDFSYYDIRNLVAIYAAIEPLIFRLIAPSRHGNDYALPCGEVYKRMIAKGIKPPKRLKEDTIQAVYGKNGLKQQRVFDKKRNKPVEGPMLYASYKEHQRSGNRYFALNLHSWFHRGTIEFRMHHGTTNAEKILGWLALWTDILDFTNRTTQKRLTRLMRVRKTEVDAFREAHKNFIPDNADGRATSRMAILLSRMVRPETFEYAMKRLRHFASSYAGRTLNPRQAQHQDDDVDF